MRKLSLATFAGATLLLAGAASAQTTIVETTGVAPPDEVVTYVQRETVPSIAVEGDVAVGYVVPPTVELRAIPTTRTYTYSVLNNRRVIVEPRTRRVIRVVE
ncbi:MAG TPA: DUF1236 domain-containing protein [Pseudolabrys sp.]|jgi:hypothetical protein|nr:DUF1236 domain-containing protein [Pseudolabrys sp.]